MVDFSWEDAESPPEQEQPKQPEQNVQDVENGSTFDWGDQQDLSTYQGEIDPEEQESNFGYITRNLISGSSRVVEQVFGKAGNLEGLARDVLTNYPGIVAGPVGLAIHDWVGPEAWKSMIQRSPESGRKTILPNSKELRDLSEWVTGGYTKPIGKKEKVAHEVIEDLGALTSFRRLPRMPQAAIAGLANIGKQATEFLGFSESKGDAVKMGIWTVLSLANSVSAPREAARMMNDARQNFDPALQANNQRYLARLQAVASDPNLLASDPRTALARQQISLLQQNIANGQNSIQSLMTAYDGVNAAKRTTGMFELTRPSDRRFASRAVDRVLGAVRQEIQDVGAADPRQLANWENGVKAWSVIHRSNGLSQWANETLRGAGKDVAKGAAASLFGAGAYAAAHDPQTALALGSAGFALNKAYQVGYRVMNDEVLMRYYANALTAAANENTSSFINNYNKLNRRLEKEEKKNQ